MTTVIIMKFKVAPGREKEFEEFVAERAQTIKKTPGLEKIYLLVPLGTTEYRLVSWWDKIKDHQSWIRKESYEVSENPKHAGLVIGTIPFEVGEVRKQW